MNSLNATTLGWGSFASQQKRFQVLSEIGDLKDRTVLDVGCGFGDFYIYARNSDYTGIDTNNERIKFAMEKYNTNFAKIDISEIKYKFDYIIASGTLTLMPPEKIEKTINHMFALCNYGVGFNLLSDKADRLDEVEYHANPGEVLEYCLTLSRKVVLRHDYMTHDFTVYLYKERP